MVLVGALALATILTNIVPAKAAIDEVTRCDGEVGDCPGSSSGPGRGHDETTQNENPSGKAHQVRISE